MYQPYYSAPQQIFIPAPQPQNIVYAQPQQQSAALVPYGTSTAYIATTNQPLPPTPITPVTPITFSPAAYPMGHAPVHPPHYHPPVPHGYHPPHHFAQPLASPQFVQAQFPPGMTQAQVHQPHSHHNFPQYPQYPPYPQLPSQQQGHSVNNAYPQGRGQPWPRLPDGRPKDPPGCKLYEIFVAPHSREHPPRHMRLRLEPDFPHDRSSWPVGYNFAEFDYVFIENPNVMGFQWDLEVTKIAPRSRKGSSRRSASIYHDERPDTLRTSQTEKRNSYLAPSSATRRKHRDSFAASQDDEEVAQRDKEKRREAEMYQKRSQRPTVESAGESDGDEDTEEISELADKFEAHSIDQASDERSQRRNSREYRAKTESSASDRKNREYVTTKPARLEARSRSSRTESDRHAR